MVAFPQVWTAPTEKPLPQPMQLLISSRVKTSVRIQSPARINDAVKMDKEYTVEPNKVLRVPISTAYMNVKSQARKGYGISIASKHPITVSTLQAWQGNGETAQHLPVESWGTSYYSMNFYQDRYGSSDEYQYRPAQILIIAESDSTHVTFRPTVSTEGGIDAPSVVKGASQTVMLMRGETFLIKSLIDTSKSRDSSADLSGTYITSTKPIGVISGHTKGAIMRMPDILPPSGQFASDANFVRNNVHDAMYPTKLAGQTFITIPLMYTPTRVVGQGSVEYGIDDDRGDVIRFVALEDSTLIRSSRTDGPGFTNVFMLQKGETRILSSHEEATFWTSSAPVLVGQYSKSYAKVVPPGIKAGGASSDDVQGHPTVEAGMPMLQMVPPIDRWISHATFLSSEGMDTFLNIVFKLNDISKIHFDGQPLHERFLDQIRSINGTDMAYIRTPIDKGSHTISSQSETVRWMAWNYASLDGLQLGRAFGTAVGIDLTMACPGDSLLDRAENSGCLDTYVTTWNSSAECGSICMIYALDLFNTSLIESEDFQPGDSIVDYHVHVGDSTKPASAVVRTLSSSGSFIDRTFEYVPDSIHASASIHDFGTQSALASSTDTLVLTNPYPNRPISVTRIFMLNGDSTFSIDGVTTPLELPPGSHIRILVTCKNLSQNSATDTLVVRTNCVDWKLTAYKVRLQRPMISVRDVDFESVPANAPTRRSMAAISNIGSTAFELRSFSRSFLSGPDSAFHVSGPNGFPVDQSLPFRLNPGESFSMFVDFQAQGYVGEFKEDVHFTTEVPSIIVAVKIRANSVDTTTSVSDEAETTGLSFIITPQPINDAATLTLTTVERGAATIELIDLNGRSVFARTEQVTVSPQSFLLRSLFVPNGLYILKIGVNGRSASTTINVYQ